MFMRFTIIVHEIEPKALTEVHTVSYNRAKWSTSRSCSLGNNRFNINQSVLVDVVAVYQYNVFCFRFDRVENTAVFLGRVGTRLFWGHYLRTRAHAPTIVIAVDTHRFQPIQLVSEWVEKVDQLNQPKTVHSIPIEHVKIPNPAGPNRTRP